MARPKAYDRDLVVIATRHLLWEKGYAATSLADLEEGTGLNRSSLYQEFGSKHALLEEALRGYLDDVVASLLADLRTPAADLETVSRFFAGLGALLRSTARPATHGCLLVNTIAERATFDEHVRRLGEDYRSRLRSAFGAALTRAGELGQIDADTVDSRAELLVALLLGVWLTTRVDTHAAIDLCQTIEREIDFWRNR